jgi:hypothetical protein
MHRNICKTVKEEHYGRPFLVDPEPKFVNVYGAQESIPPAYVAWLAELVFLNLYGAQESMPRHQFRQPM